MQRKAPTAAVLTGFEPATSTLTGWRALQLLYRTMFSEALVPRSQEYTTDAAVVAACIEHPLGGKSLVPQQDLMQKEPQALKRGYHRDTPRSNSVQGRQPMTALTRSRSRQGGPTP